MPAAIVYRGMTKEQLDAQYNIRAMIPDHPEIFKSWAARSERARDAMKDRSRLDLGYGTDPAQTLDLFLAGEAGAPLLIFIHGGYWRAQDKSEFSYVAEPYVAAGICVAVVNYRLAPRVAIDDIVSDIRQSIIWLYGSAAGHGYDRNHIFVSGTSAGGHLTVSALATPWPEHGLPADVLKGGCALSGLYDLEPIRLCYINREIGMSEETMKRQSVIDHLPAQAPPLILSTGGDESAEFKRHQRELAEAWRQAGLSCTVIDQPDGHHFDIIERFIEMDGLLGQSVLALVRAGA
ncbi:MAG TPA: alpha/beta hydrolase [Burkholderiales bacterium]|nr:alpha/beta hydrolase [Burkholderiales bacterium]